MLRRDALKILGLSPVLPNLMTKSGSVDYGEFPRLPILTCTDNFGNNGVTTWYLLHPGDRKEALSHKIRLKILSAHYVGVSISPFKVHTRSEITPPDKRFDMPFDQVVRPKILCIVEVGNTKCYYFHRTSDLSILTAEMPQTVTGVLDWYAHEGHSWAMPKFTND